MKHNKISTIICAVLIMTILFSLAGCSRSQQEEPTAAPTEAPAAAPTEAATEAPTEPAPTEPMWERGLVKANYVEAVHSLLNKGDEVDVVGKYAHYYVISGEPCNLLVDENYIRLASEEPFKSWTAYSRNKKPVYDSVYMEGEPIETLKSNTKLTVLDGKNGWFYVEWENGKGYMKEEDITKYRGGGSGSGSGGSSSGSSPSGGGGGSSADGTDVNVGNLSATGSQYSIVKLGAYHGPEMEAGFKADKGVVLADKVEAFIAVLGYGDELKVTAFDEETCTVYLDADLTVTIPRYMVKLDVDSVEEPFIGYTKYGAVAYKEYQGRNAHKTMKTNNKVEVLYKLPAEASGGEEIYVVSIDGEIMYMQVASVSEHKITSGGGGGGSSSGSGSGGGDVWTPPAL